MNISLVQIIPPLPDISDMSYWNAAERKRVKKARSGREILHMSEGTRNLKCRYISSKLERYQSNIFSHRRS
jgi:hypothetical protein